MTIMTIMINQTLLHLYNPYIRNGDESWLQHLSTSDQPMLKRGSIHVSMIPNSTLLMGWCRGRRRVKRRRGSTVRLGNKAKRRGFWIGSRPVVQWGVMVGPLRMLKKIITEITVKEKFIEAYYMYLPLLRPQLFPLCWYFRFSFLLLIMYS